MENRISTYLRDNRNKKLLIPFLTAGFPDKNSFLNLISLSVDCGVDMIEIGVPFSDPLADGAEVQFSSFEALKKGNSLKEIVSLGSRLREKVEIPLILMGYFNPIYKYGEQKYLLDMCKNGLDGLIIPDLPIEEAGSFKKLADKNNISTIFLAAPTSSNKRLKKISNFSSDFVYAVTVTGVTGTGKVFNTDTDNYFKRLRQNIKKPFVAGFGIASASDAKRMVKYADGVVIGSAIIKLIRRAKNKREMLKSTGRLLKSIRNAI